MKESKLITLLLAISANCLFYNQLPGINLLLFTLISIAALVYLNQEKGIQVITVATLPVLSCAIFIVIVPQVITIYLWFIAYLLMWSSMMTTRYAISTFMQGFASLIQAPFKALYNRKKHKVTDVQPLYQKFMVVCVTGFIVFTFVVLYINSNPVFQALVRDIDLSFIEVKFLCWILIYCLLLFGLVQIFTNKHVQKLDNRPATITEQPLQDPSNQAYQIAKYSFTLLGIILLVMNLGDVFVLFTGQLPEGVSYSAYVHQSFNLLLFTISLAIMTMLFFFRGALNFHPNQTILKYVTIFWISQNLILVAITAYKNGIYIDAYGLTYKRIAVFCFLAVVAIGLIFMIFKVRYKHSNWFYINQMAVSGFVCACLIGLTPIDSIITRYNLTQIENPDIHYLLRLNQTDLKYLISYLENAKEPSANGYLKCAYNQLHSLETKTLNQDWMSWNWYNDYIITTD